MWSFLPLEYPTDSEIDELAHVWMTNPVPWNPDEEMDDDAGNPAPEPSEPVPHMLSHEQTDSHHTTPTAQTDSTMLA